LDIKRRRISWGAVINVKRRSSMTGQQERREAQPLPPPPVTKVPEQVTRRRPR